MGNTSDYIPVEAVVPIVLKHKECKEYPFLSGTGFFVMFPPYPDVFFVTARHCVFDDNGTPLGSLQIPWSNSEGCREAIPFSCCLSGKTGDSGKYFEDVAVFVVDEMPKDRKSHLRERALMLKNQDDVNSLISYVNASRENLRIVGFPGCSKYIDFDSERLVAAPRGIFGKITQGSLKQDRYEVSELNWTGGEINGFSGSPVLSLNPTSSGGVARIPVGVVVNGSSKKFHAVNINVVTDLIAGWIAHKANLDIGCVVEVENDLRRRPEHDEER
jgi:hypothetical protein